MPFLSNSTFTAKGKPVTVLKNSSYTRKTMVNQSFSESALAVQQSTEQTIEERMDCAEPTSSQVPSPPDSRSPTPRFNLDICPKRLYPLIPPRNYGAIQEYLMYRSSFPQRENIEFLKFLDLRSILTLTTKNDPCETYLKFVSKSGISHKIMELETNKEGEINMKPDNMSEALMFALNPANHPIFVHCNQGRHRTGCFVACIRKIQGWTMEDILNEYDTYANPKPRDGDLAFIKTFDPKVVSQFADKNPHLKWRTDSVLGSFDLLAGLSTTRTAPYVPEGSVVSDSSDPGLMLAAPRTIDPALANGAAPVLQFRETVLDEDSGMSETVTEFEVADDEEMMDAPPSPRPASRSLTRVPADA